MIPFPAGRGRSPARERRLSPVIETTLVVVPSALELLTILSIATRGEILWHAATVAALLLRRRWPVLVFCLTLPVAFNGYLLLAPMGALYQVARQVSRRRTLVICVLLLCAAGLVPWLPTEEEPFSYEDALFGLLSAAMLSAGPAAMGRLLRTREELSARLTELARTQERERGLLAERAVTEERARLAREMHDVVSHQVGMISVQAGALQMTSEEPASQEVGRTIHSLSVSTLQELRHLVGVLREARDRQGLAEIAALVDTSGLETRLVAEEELLDDRNWPGPVGEAAYRTVQEALTNVLKYAPDATVTVTLSAHRTAEDRFLLVEVRNTAPRRPRAQRLPAGGHGLLGLRERAELLGGTFLAAPAPDGGFLVRVTLPAPDGRPEQAEEQAQERASAEAPRAVPGRPDRWRASAVSRPRTRAEHHESDGSEGFRG